MKLPTLSSYNFKNKLVLLRSDLNSDVKNGKILDSVRIKASAETIKELKRKGARVVVIAHQGRPDGKDFTSMDFLRKTPQVGLSGKGSLDSMPEEKRKRFLAEKKVLSSYGEEAYTFVDEKTEEMDFYAGKEESIEKEVTVKEEVEEEEKLVVVG